MSGPKYRRGADVIKAKIASGEIVGEITLGRMRELTGATSSTARRAAKELVNEGVLENHPGSPYTVIGTPEDVAEYTIGRPPAEDAGCRASAAVCRVAPRCTAWAWRDARAFRDQPRGSVRQAWLRHGPRWPRRAPVSPEKDVGAQGSPARGGDVVSMRAHASYRPDYSKLSSSQIVAARQKLGLTYCRVRRLPQ